jgi:PAS domain S-box-containing protein
MRDDIRPVGDKWGGKLAETWKRGDQEIESVLQLTDETMELLPKHRETVVQLRLAAISLDLLSNLEHVRSIWADIRELVSQEVVIHERRLEGRSEMVRRLVIGGIAVLSLISLAIAIMLRRSVIFRLNQLSHYAISLLKRDSAPKLSPSSDEIGDLAASFEVMAQELREITRRERAVIDHAADVICVFSRDGEFLQASPAARSLWGYSPDELSGKLVIELLPEADRARFVEVFAASCASAGAETIEATVITKAGRELATRFATRWSTETEQLVCVAHDITEMVARERQLRENEERMRVLAEELPAAMFLLDDRFIIERINGNSADLIGTTDDGIVGIPFSKFIPEFEKMAPGGPVLQTLLVSQTGNRWVELSVDRFDDRNRARYLIIALDVNERMELKAFRDKLIAMIAHDIGTPLSSLQMIFKLLAMGRYGAVSQSGVKQANDAEEQTARLIKLFKDFVTIERQQSRQYNSSS